MILPYGKCQHQGIAHVAKLANDPNSPFQFKNRKNTGIDEAKNNSKKLVCCINEGNTDHTAELALFIIIMVIIITVVGSIYTLISLTSNNRHSNSQFFAFASTINDCLKSSEDMIPPVVSFSCDSDTRHNYETQLAHTIVSCNCF